MNPLTIIYNAFIYGIIFETIKFVVYHAVVYTLNKITSSGSTGRAVIPFLNGFNQFVNDINQKTKYDPKINSSKIKEKMDKL